MLRRNPLTPVLGRLLVTAILFCTVLPLTAAAQNNFIAQNGNGPQNGAPPGQEQGESGISQRRALEMIRASFPGNVVSINQVQRNGGVYYRVRMDDGGNIFTLYVNAATGEITREQ